MGGDDHVIDYGLLWRKKAHRIGKGDKILGRRVRKLSCKGKREGGSGARCRRDLAYSVGAVLKAYKGKDGISIPLGNSVEVLGVEVQDQPVKVPIAYSAPPGEKIIYPIIQRLFFVCSST